MRKAIRKEINVVLFGQPLWFRVVKYIVLFVIVLFFYQKFHWQGVVALLFTLFLMGTTLHFVFRWKTNGWTKSWGFYKVRAKKCLAELK